MAAACNTDAELEGEGKLRDILIWYSGVWIKVIVS